MTDRELKVKYINDTMGIHTPNRMLYTELYDKRYSYMKENVADLVEDICQRIEGGAYHGFFDSWQEKCYDDIIAKIDWSKVSQCDTCHKYFDPAVRYGRWCSDLCQVDYEEDNDRRDR